MFDKYTAADHINSNFLKVVSHKFYLVHSWILCPRYSKSFNLLMGKAKWKNWWEYSSGKRSLPGKWYYKTWLCFPHLSFSLTVIKDRNCAKQWSHIPKEWLLRIIQVNRITLKAVIWQKYYKTRFIGNGVTPNDATIMDNLIAWSLSELSCRTTSKMIVFFWCKAVVCRCSSK